MGRRKTNTASLKSLTSSWCLPNIRRPHPIAATLIGISTNNNNNNATNKNKNYDNNNINNKDSCSVTSHVYITKKNAESHSEYVSKNGSRE